MPKTDILKYLKDNNDKINKKINLDFKTYKLNYNIDYRNIIVHEKDLWLIIDDKLVWFDYKNDIIQKDEIVYKDGPLIFEHENCILFSVISGDFYVSRMFYIDNELKKHIFNNISKEEN